MFTIPRVEPAAHYLEQCIKAMEQRALRQKEEIHKKFTKNVSTQKKTKEEMKEFGLKDETYEDILKRLLKSAKERQLHDLLMDDTNTITIEEARDNMRELWDNKEDEIWDEY